MYKLHENIKRHTTCMFYDIGLELQYPVLTFIVHSRSYRNKDFKSILIKINNIYLYDYKLFR